MRILLSALLLVGAAGSASAGPGDDELRVRWLGVAGFELAAGDTVLLHDPYLSRHGMLRSLFRRYVPDEERLEGLLAPGSPLASLADADVILIGHAHFDHLGDAPWLALRSGASLVGSATAVHVARGYGLPEERGWIRGPGDVVEAPPFRVRVVESRHAVLYGDEPPLPGTVDAPPDAPIHSLSFKLGDARGYLVTHVPSGRRIYVLSSAGFEPEALRALGEDEAPVDVVLAAAAGGGADYADALVAQLRPRVVVPHHFDSFFTALDEDDAAAPTDEDALAAFEAELRAAAVRHGVELEVRRPALFQPLALP